MAKFDKKVDQVADVKKPDLLAEVDSGVDDAARVGLWCPRCKATRGRVARTVQEKNKILRYRKCDLCGYSFTTKEERG